MVYWEATCLVWRKESCVTAARFSCARVVHWKVKVTSSLTDVCQKLSITVARHHSNSPMYHSLSPLATQKPHQCTSTWRHRLKPKCRNTFIRNQHSMSMGWNGIWLKCSQQPADSFIDRSIDEWRDCFIACLKAKANTLNICYDVFLYDM